MNFKQRGTSHPQSEFNYVVKRFVNFLTLDFEGVALLFHFSYNST